MRARALRPRLPPLSAAAGRAAHSDGVGTMIAAALSLLAGIASGWALYRKGFERGYRLACKELPEEVDKVIAERRWLRRNVRRES